MAYYGSPRWSGEIYDCSMPVTFDTYSNCSYGCLYCQPPEALVWRPDGTWTPIGSISTGDSVVGFQRLPGKRRPLCTTWVTQTFRREAPLVRVHLASGRSVRCTPDHPWFTGRVEPQYSYMPAHVGRPLIWVEEPREGQAETEEYKRGYVVGLVEGDGTITDRAYRYPNRSMHVRNMRLAMKDQAILSRFAACCAAIGLDAHKGTAVGLDCLRLYGQKALDILAPQNMPDTDECWRGWLGGIFDAEGSVSTVLRIAQYRDVNPETHRRICSALGRFGFDALSERQSVRLRGGRSEILRFWALTTPTDSRKVLRTITGRMSGTPDMVTAIEPDGTGEVVSLRTATGNYIAQGYASRNCFSAYQRDLGKAKANYRHKSDVRAVNPAAVRRMWTGEVPSQFTEFLALRRPIQWGGLSDQFDEYERRLGVSLEVLRFFRETRYPVCFSTKAAWWTEDERYAECFRGAEHFNVKFSIISLDEAKVKAIELGTPTAEERLKAMERVASWGGGGVTLRLRPFIVGMSNPGHTELICCAAECGATAVSTEFFCLEQRSLGGKATRYPAMSAALGYDIESYYRRHSTGSGYLRLNRALKRPYVNQMERAAREHGLRFYVSDAHFKERCDNGSCCGLPPTWNYTRGQNCEALMIAKRTGKVAWADIAGDLDYAKRLPFGRLSGFNQNSSERRATYEGQSLYDYLRYQWNHPGRGNSPWRMFGGIVKPEAVDANGDVVYAYDVSKA